MDTKLAAWIKPSIDHQQTQNLLPVHRLPPDLFFQPLVPELLQFQLPSQFTSQPAISEGSDTTQFHLSEPHPQAVYGGRYGNRIVSKQTECPTLLRAFVEDLNVCRHAASWLALISPRCNTVRCMARRKTPA
jgi:hypothetical protein